VAVEVSDHPVARLADTSALLVYFTLSLQRHLSPYFPDRPN
jgi:hypothetical protein